MTTNKKSLINITFQYRPTHTVRLDLSREYVSLQLWTYGMDGTSKAITADKVPVHTYKLAEYQPVDR